MLFYDLIVNAIPFMRASEDAHMPLFFDPKAASQYLEDWAIVRMTR